MAGVCVVVGGPEIYVERYPELGDRQQISTGGGRNPVWSRDGRELFFSSADSRQMLSVSVESATTLAPGRPQVLFQFATLVAPAPGGSRPYDIAPDGRFFVISSGPADAATAPPTHLVLVQNWQEELKRQVPTD